MSFVIRGIGTALPATALTQQRAAELTSLYSGHDAEQARRLAILYRRTGIATRHIVLLDRADLPSAAAGPNPKGPTTLWRMRRYDEQVRPLALEAARRAIAAAGIAPGEITHLVTVSCTGFAAPGFDVALIEDLALNPTVERTHLGFMGCHGALNGLRVARALTGSDPSACVLLCAAELCSLHFQYGFDAEQAVANALFADGAAALVGSSSAAAGTPDPWRLAGNGSCVVPGTADVMTWHIGDHGFEMTLSPRVSHIIAAHLRPWLAGWLVHHGLDVNGVASWAIHPGGPRILDAVEEALSLDRTATAPSREVLTAYGNVSSPTVLLILDRLRRLCASLPCVALAFGPGLTIEAALFTG
jgi:predicted naringenin-chalcone synthase